MIAKDYLSKRVYNGVIKLTKKQSLINRRFILDAVRSLCNHDWEIQDNPCKRICCKCQKHEWIFTKRFPRIGEPASEWKDMSFDRFL